MKTLRCPQVYNKYVLKGMFLEGFSFSVRHCARLFWSNIEHAALQKLPNEPTSLKELQEAARKVDTSSIYLFPPTVIS